MTTKYPIKIDGKIAIIIDEKILHQLGITEDTILIISIDGRQLIIEKSEDVEQRAQKNKRVKEIIDEITQEYAEDLEKLAQN